MKFFSQNLKYLRKQSGKSQPEVCEEMGYSSRSRLANYEGGVSTPNVEDLITLAKYYDVNIDDLLNRDISIPREEISEEDVSFLTLQVHSLEQRVKTLQQLNELLSTDNKILLTENQNLLTKLKAAQDALKAVKTTKDSNKK